VAQAGDVVHDACARCERGLRDGGLARVDREGRGQLLRERLDHRAGALDLERGRHFLRAGPRRLAADVEHVRAGRDERPRGRHGRTEVGPARRREQPAAVRERVGRQVQHAHDRHAAGREDRRRSHRSSAAS
jgi:hypothetical protein